MKILQVKKYNETIAKEKWGKADKCHLVSSMFFFYLDNEETRRKGFNIPRQNGYIAFDETKACFGMTPEKAEKKFNA